MPDDIRAAVEGRRHSRKLAGEAVGITQEFVNSILAGRTPEQLRAEREGNWTLDSMPGSRVDTAREDLLEQAMELSAYLTQLAGNRRTVEVAGNVTIQAFNVAVNNYQLALEEH